MKANVLSWKIALAAVSLVAGNAFAQATPDGKPAASLYDQFPDCMNRGQVAAGDPAPCELPAPPASRRPRAPLGSNVSEATPLQSVPANAGTIKPAPGAGMPGTAGSGQGSGTHALRSAR
ncbi:MAG TPA: hypothetical protein VGN52_17315 [Burkholderiales bacterium]